MYVCMFISSIIPLAQMLLIRHDLTCCRLYVVCLNRKSFIYMYLYKFLRDTYFRLTA